MQGWRPHADLLPQIWAQKVITQNSALSQLHPPQSACLQAVMLWQTRCLCPLHHRTAFPWWPLCRCVPQIRPCDGITLIGLDCMSSSWAAPRAESWSPCSGCSPRALLPGVPRHACTVQPCSAWPGTQEGCGKARNKTIARKTSWQSWTCPIH